MWEEVETYEEYEERWRQDYPDELIWYRLVIVEGFERDGTLRYRGVGLGGKTIISAMMNAEEDHDDPFDRPNAYSADAAVELCSLILPAVQESMNLLSAGTYNDMVESSLPYQFRTGVIRRSDVWKYEPEDKERSRDGLSDEVINKYRELMLNLNLPKHTFAFMRKEIENALKRVDHTDEQVLLLGVGEELHISLTAMVTDHGKACTAGVRYNKRYQSAHGNRLMKVSIFMSRHGST